MVTHKSANFTFSTYLHLMTKDLMALSYISSNLADHSVLKACSAAPITPICVGSVIVRSPLFAPLELWWPKLGFGQGRQIWSRKKAGFPKSRRCHGSTSPSLANMPILSQCHQFRFWLLPRLLSVIHVFLVLSCFWLSLSNFRLSFHFICLFVPMSSFSNCSFLSSY